MAVVFTGYFGLYCGDSKCYETANRNRAILLGILDSSHLDGYTIADAKGAWHGQTEPTAVLTVIGQDNEAVELGNVLAEIATEYKHAAEQDCVWLTRRHEDLLII